MGSQRVTVAPRLEVRPLAEAAPAPFAALSTIDGALRNIYTRLLGHATHEAEAPRRP